MEWVTQIILTHSRESPSIRMKADSSNLAYEQIVRFSKIAHFFRILEHSEV